MRLGHRARLTLISGATAGFLLAGVFAAVFIAAVQSERRQAEEMLERALGQARSEVAGSPTQPDLAEVAASDSTLTLAAFDAAGHPIAKSGRLPVDAGTPGGIGALPSGVNVIARIAKQGSIRIVGAEPWQPHEEALRKLALLLVGLWIPLTGCASLVTWFAVTATFRPLDALAGQAERLSEMSLSGRLDLPPGDEYAEFAARLNRFLSRLEDSLRRQQQFVDDAAHELRTPLTVIRGRIETTLRRSRTEAEYSAALETTLNEAERLSALVEALLQTAAPTSEPVGEVDLEVAAERAHARWVDRFSEADVRLDLTTAPAQAAVRDAELDVLLDNLLSNALRASPAGTACRITVAAHGGFARVEVEDEGPGIPPEMADQIFERFTRADRGRNRDAGGFGIGLAVCRRLVEARAGTIRADHPPTGARFIIELPLCGPESTTQQCLG